LKKFIDSIISSYQLKLDLDRNNRDQSLSNLIQAVGWLKNNRIPNLQRERIKVDWLYKINIHLANFIKSPHFSDIHFWRFEDECMYLHMDLSTDTTDSEYWQQKLREKTEWRDEFFKQFRELLPPSKLKEL